METMPRSVRPSDPEWSDDLDAATIAYGTPVRWQIIRTLRSRGPLMRYQLSKETGIKPALVTQSLNKLEEAGVVSANLPPEERSTRALTYTLNRERADSLLADIERYVKAAL